MAFVHFAVCLPTIQIVLIGILIITILFKLRRLYKLINEMKRLREIRFADSISSENNVQDEEKEPL